jgi:hypothetical protein
MEPSFTFSVRSGDTPERTFLHRSMLPGRGSMLNSGPGLCRCLCGPILDSLAVNSYLAVKLIPRCRVNFMEGLPGFCVSAEERAGPA